MTDSEHAADTLYKNELEAAGWVHAGSEERKWAESPAANHHTSGYSKPGRPHPKLVDAVRHSP